MKNYILFFIFSLLFISQTTLAQNTNYVLKENISYITDSNATEYAKERCKLDLYYPENAKDYTTVVWFHGGGLTGGEKFIPEKLKEKGIAVIGVNYRLYPKVKCPVYIEDAAAAVAWAF